MAGFHITANGDVKKCTAEKRACPLRKSNGDPVPHYATAEQAYEALYAKKSLSLNESLKYEEKYADWADKDQDIEKIINNAFTGKKWIKAKIGSESITLPVKSIRQSSKSKNITDALRRDFDATMAAQKALPSTTRMATQYASLSSLEGDIKILKARASEDAISNVMYVNAANDGAFHVQTSASIDKERLLSDLDAKQVDGKDREALYTTSDKGYSVSKVKAAFNAIMAEKIPKGSKGAPAARKAAWDQSGLAHENISYVPDPKMYTDVMASNPEAVIAPRFSDGQVDSMSGSTVRATLCELGVQHQALKDAVTNDEERLRRESMKTSNNPTAAFKNLADQPSGHLKFKASKSTVLNDKAIDDFAAAYGLSKKDLRNTNHNMSVDNLKRFSDAHGMSAYRYLKPRKSVSFRDMSDQKSYDQHNVVARG
jgi:hypothetical protein